MSDAPRYWAIVPAAGVGKRMGSAIPKQYLPLAGLSVIEQTLRRLLSNELIQTVYVAISKQDEWWPESQYAGHPRVVRSDGGTERCHSVLNALNDLSKIADDFDWVLVHDAARPCLREEDLEHLVEQASKHEVGGLLGVPVRDTMKRSDETDQVTETVSRERLWHAFTPQMFRLGQLRSALKLALHKGWLVTDEASAIELSGLNPLMVEGHADNIKITRPEDLALATFFLQQQ